MDADTGKWSGRSEIDSALDGSVTNAGVARYRQLNGQHLEVLEAGRVHEDGVYLVVETNQSHIRMAQAARTRVFVEGQLACGDPMALACGDRTTQLESSCARQRIVLESEQHRPIRVEKVVALCSSQRFAQSEPSLQARKLITRAASFDKLLARHVLAWSHLWKRCDLILRNNPRTQFVLRFHLFHLLQMASHHTVDRDVGIPARGWHGEAYRGHIFWDELFVFPCFDLRLPEMTRELLMYEIARFWASIAALNTARGRYEIRQGETIVTKLVQQ